MIHDYTRKRGIRLSFFIQHFAVIVAISLTCGAKAIAQCTPCNDPAPALSIEFNSAALSILRGANLEFNFNTIDNYRNGIALNAATILGITICDCTSEVGVPSGDNYAGSTVDGYSIYFDTDDANINGMSGSVLPLCMIEAEANIFQGFAPNNITNSGTRVPLGAYPTAEGALFRESSAPATVTSRFWSTDQIAISYYVGVSPANIACSATFPLLSNTGLTSDSYFVTISYTLVPECTSCGDGYTEY